MCAGWGGHVAAVKALLGAGARINATRAADGSTALVEAACNGNASCVKLLVDAGAIVSGAGGGLTPLQGAARFARPAAVELLLATRRVSASDVASAQAQVGRHECGYGDDFPFRAELCAQSIGVLESGR